jgi:ADP-ribose pyrophosphatase YjhB (NUDIX family)
MQNNVQNHLLQLLKKQLLEKNLKEKFKSRIKEGIITRDENPTSHFCVYFAAFDPANSQVFFGKHIKSGLWLFNGGHIDKNESLEDALYREMKEEWDVIQKVDINSPSLFTYTQIENQKKQKCRMHYDIWYFIPFDKQKFSPNTKLLSKEFSEWGWKTIKEAQSLTRDEATQKGLIKIQSNFLIY